MHCCNPEYIPLKSDATMEALRDRTIKVNVPFLMEWQENERLKKAQSDRLKKYKEELENSKCFGNGLQRGEMIAFISADTNKQAKRLLEVAGFEHLHVDGDFSLLEGFADAHEPDVVDVARSHEHGHSYEEYDRSAQTVIIEEAHYQGHPCGTPPPEPTGCTCDIMLLMAQGCKCGWIDKERAKKDEN